MGLENYLLETHPKSNPGAIVQGDKYRITVLTESLIRMEYSESGIFEDRPTQAVINRDFPLPEFQVRETAEEIQLSTSRLELHYNRKKFTACGLMVHPLERVSGETGFPDWHYGDELFDLGGTARTLDNASGAVPLETGLMSLCGRSVIDDSRSMTLTEDGFVKVREHKETDIYIWIYGYRFLECLKDFYHLCGKTPLLPRYALGNWWSRFHRYTEEEYRELMERFDKENIPFSVAVIDSDWHLKDEVDPKYGSGYTGYTWNRSLFPEPEKFMKWLHERNMKVTLNVHPNDGIRAFEEPYRLMAEAMGIDPDSEQTVYFDVTDPVFLEKYLTVVNHYLENQGVDFWWLDWQQGETTKIPGLDPLWMLNHYHYLDSKWKNVRPLTFSRYAGVGSHRYPIGFSGDSYVTWESLDFQPYFTSTASNIGYGWWSHDIGGHMQGYSDQELITRWVQYGVFSPINRLHSTDSPFNGKEPWNYNRISCAVMSDFLRLRHALIPYLYCMNRRASRDGLPLVLPVYYYHPKLTMYFEKMCRNEYYFGTELLCAPITEKMDPDAAVAKVNVWLPEGQWIDFFTGTIYQGGRWMEFWRGMDEIPVLMKAGAIVPMQNNEVSTNSVDNPKNMELRIFPAASGEFLLWEDQGDTPEDLDENWVCTRLNMNCEQESTFIIENAMGNLAVIPEERSWKLVFSGMQDTAVTVTADGEIISAKVSYNAKKAALTVEIPSISVQKRITVHFTEQIAIKENDIADRCFDILYRANMGYTIKRELYNQIQKLGKDAISTVMMLDLNPALKGALIEIMTAQ